MALRGMLVENADPISSDSALNEINRDYTRRENEKRICHKCGSTVTEGSKFCSRCGERLIADSDSRRLLPDNSIDFADKKSETKESSTKEIKTDTPKGKIITDTMGAARKKLGMALVIIGLVVGVGGLISATVLADAYRPHKVYNGYRDPDTGEFVETGHGEIGGNYEAVSFFESMEAFFVIGGVIILVMGAGLYLSGENYEKLRPITKLGKVVGLDNMNVSIEFKDGSRNRYLYRPNVVLVNGDEGKFTIKERSVIGFEKLG